MSRALSLAADALALAALFAVSFALWVALP